MMMIRTIWRLGPVSATTAMAMIRVGKERTASITSRRTLSSQRGP